MCCLQDLRPPGPPPPGHNSEVSHGFNARSNFIWLSSLDVSCVDRKKKKLCYTYANKIFSHPQVIDSSQDSYDAAEKCTQETPATLEAPSEESVIVISSEDKENERPPFTYEVPSEDLGCFEVPSSGDENGYDLGSENDDGCTILSPEPPRQTYPLTPIDNCHTWSRSVNN